MSPVESLLSGFLSSQDEISLDDIYGLIDCEECKVIPEGCLPLVAEKILVRLPLDEETLEEAMYLLTMIAERLSSGFTNYDRLVIDSDRMDTTMLIYLLNILLASRDGRYLDVVEGFLAHSNSAVRQEAQDILLEWRMILARMDG